MPETGAPAAAPRERISFFDAISANKRNSLLLMLALSAIFLALLWAVAYMFRLGPLVLVPGAFALIFYSIAVFFAGDKVILAVSGARKVTAKEQPFLYNVVEGLALASQIPVPEVYVIEDPSPNAFATGRDPKHASVAVTTGLLQMMKREELEGVLAHEISHIANYDIRFMMVAVVFVGAIALVSEFATRTIFYGAMFGGRDRGGRRGGGSGLFALIAIALMILAPILAMLVQLAISRQREYLADANGAKLTRYPEGLASALEKISRASIPMQNASSTTAPLYISNPFGQKAFSLMSTHPPAEDRIRKLRGM